MTLEERKQRLVLPEVAAPTLLLSGPELAIAACQARVVGTLPAANARTTDELAIWLDRAEKRAPVWRRRRLPAAGPMVVSRSRQACTSHILILSFYS
jgi:NAD(P)H-dependent flavin oxidoreductase YrpB (nitropropane dioxygenase family)